MSMAGTGITLILLPKECQVIELSNSSNGNKTNFLKSGMRRP